MNKAPPSPKLMRLDADIKAEKDPVKAGCLRAERAGLLGRLGFFEESKCNCEHLDANCRRMDLLL
jgi:hypothetical protein